MEVFRPLSPVVPVSARRSGLRLRPLEKISLASATEIIVYLATPSLVFTSLASRPLFALEIAVLFSGVVIVFAPKLLDP